MSERPFVGSEPPVVRAAFHDEDGAVLFEEVEQGGQRWVRRPDGNGGYIANAEGVRRVLWNLPRLREHLADGRAAGPVYVTEGTSDARALEAHLAAEGLPGVVTTNPFGALSWLPEYTEALTGAAEVIATVDNDDAGRKRAALLERELGPVVEALRILRSPLEEKGADVRDHLAAGLGLVELVTPAEAATAAAPASLEEVVGAFQRWLYLPDADALLAVLATVAANTLGGDPVWLLVVGPPGSGKTELLAPLTALDDAHSAATLTEAALLSGTAKRDHDPGARGGLLRIIGEFGLVIAKDFGSVLSMGHDARAATLAALREIYDGSWTRLLGTGGGKVLHWQGKVGLLAGCTPTIDRHHGVMAAMGERFVLFRLPPVDPAEQARAALRHAGREREMRDELRRAVAGLFVGGRPPRAPRALSDEERERLVSLASLVVRCRSAVERDRYSREVELVGEPEAPTRLVVVLDRLLAGLDAIGAERTAAWRVVAKAALDSVPALRLAAVAALHASGRTTTTAVAEAVRHPSNTTRRALEDLAAHGIVVRLPQGQGKADEWELSDFTTAHYGRAVGKPGGPDAEQAERLLERHADLAGEESAA